MIEISHNTAIAHISRPEHYYEIMSVRV